MEARCAGAGVHDLDAPISGGVAKAAAGQLSVMAGGSPQVFAAAQPVLAATAATVFTLGGVAGPGSAMKAVNRLLAGVHIAAMAEAIGYATAIGARNVHVMGGVASGPVAWESYCANLTYACVHASRAGLTILIEPPNTRDAPGHVLQTTGQARGLIDDLRLPNLKPMFDCYHVQIMEGDLTRRLTDLLPVIGHIQSAGVPDRGLPDRSEVRYPRIFAHIAALGWDAPPGAEDRPGGPTDASLGWLRDLS